MKLKKFQICINEEVQLKCIVEISLPISLVVPYW